MSNRMLDLVHKLNMLVSFCLIDYGVSMCFHQSDHFLQCVAVEQPFTWMSQRQFDPVFIVLHY